MSSFLDTAMSDTPAVAAAAAEAAIAKAAAESLVANINSAEAVDKNTLVHKVFEYLRSVKGHIFVTSEVIRLNTNIDIDLNPELRAHLVSSKKCQVEGELFKYVAPYGISNVNELQSQLPQYKQGLAMADLLDCYNGIEADVDELVLAGTIIAVKNKKDNRLVLFPRGSDYFVELRANAILKAKDHRSVLATSGSDLRDELRRGDLVVIGSVLGIGSRSCELADVRHERLRRTFRVSMAADSGTGTKTSGNNKNEDIIPPWKVAFDRATYCPNAYSASSVKDLEEQSKPIKDGFQWKFSEKKLPLNPICRLTPSDMPAHEVEAAKEAAAKEKASNGSKRAKQVKDEKPSDSSDMKVRAYKMGCSNDLRKLWWDTALKNEFTWPNDRHALNDKLKKARIISQADVDVEKQEEAARVKRMKNKAAADSKRRKNRRYNSRSKISNEHMLEGADASYGLAAMLAENKAAKKQQE